MLRHIRAAYEAFEYATVIQLADKLLDEKDSLAASDLTEVYLLKATSHFSLGDEAEARRSFLSLLDLQPDFKPDSSTVSPKIMRFFEKVRSEYFRSAEQKQQTPKDTTSLARNVSMVRDDPTRGAILRSFVLPGWGHAYISDSPKCWILLSAGAATLGSMTYFIVTTASREKDYLNETRPQLIEEKYDRYNSSFKLRNAFVATYVVLWLYAQVDLLLLSDNMFTHGQPFSLVPTILANHSYGVLLSLRLDFPR